MKNKERPSSGVKSAEGNSAPHLKAQLPRGVIFNAYPDSVGGCLLNCVKLFEHPEFKGAFSQFYILPTIYNSDLDRGFSVVDYNLNRELVSPVDLKLLNRAAISLKLDLVLNHLSAGSPQFQDLLQKGDASVYREFFIDWNSFWAGRGEMGSDGCIIPCVEHLQKLFMRKPGLPVLKVSFPDGSERCYWNTFYQEVHYEKVEPPEVSAITGDGPGAEKIAEKINELLNKKADPEEVVPESCKDCKGEIIKLIRSKRRYLGQVDLNAASGQVWNFYRETLARLNSYGAKVVRLDAFAYLHKAPGRENFFNRPETWHYLSRLTAIGEGLGLTLLPEIHAEYGSDLHSELARHGYPLYDFFFPGLVIHALESGTAKHLLAWISEILEKDLAAVNMLGCHDGIPVLDLKGKMVKGANRVGLLSDEQIDNVINLIISRGGRVKNLYSPSGEKISYYQVNATFYSALGENDRKLLLARAIQIFMPGTPQVWYLDLFAGCNDYAAADSGGSAGHKEINRTNLTLDDVEIALQKPLVKSQLTLLRLRNTNPAFHGKLEIGSSGEQHLLNLTWRSGKSSATLQANLQTLQFEVKHTNPKGETETISSL
jgi:sucrose phosphorylase